MINIFSRRTLIKAGFAGVISSHTLGAQARNRVLVLGAGVAGLTAALSLKACGHDVTVIEFQERVGGRIWSLPLKNGQYTELGAGHFSADMPLVSSLIKRYQLPLLTINDGLPRYTINGKSCDANKLTEWPWDLNKRERNSTISAILGRYLVESGVNLNSVLDPSWPDSHTIEKFDGVTLTEVLRAAGASDAFLRLLQAHGGAPYGSASMLGVLSSIAYQFNAQAYVRIAGGNNRIVNAMAKEFGGRIVLGAPVVAIDQKGGQVTVTVKDGREFFGDQVVCTIPFSVIQDVQVTPGWSPEKQRMFRETSWADAFKGVVQTTEPYWLRKGLFGWPMAGSDQAWERVIDISGNEGGDYGNVFFYLYGKGIDAVKSLPVAERTPWILEQFRKNNPDLIDQVVMMSSILWSEQPWVKAAFGGPSLGSAWMIKEWSKPEGQVHFAGDFTSMKSGWVEGAIESGLRAARAIDPTAPGL